MGQNQRTYRIEKRFGITGISYAQPAADYLVIVIALVLLYNSLDKISQERR